MLPEELFYTSTAPKLLWLYRMRCHPHLCTHQLHTDTAMDRHDPLGLVALRLILPLSVSSTLSLLQLGNAADLPAQLENALNSDGTYRGNYKTAIEGSHEYELAVSVGSPVTASTEGGKIAYYYERANGSIAPAKTSYELFLTIGSRVWLAGIAALWLWAVCSYLRLKYRLRFSIRLSKGIYETDAVPSPCVTGILRPQIYLIPALTDQQKEHILLHEKCTSAILIPSGKWCPLS